MFLGMKTERSGFKTHPTCSLCDLALCQSLGLRSVRIVAMCCYGWNVCIPPTFMHWSPYYQCDAIKRLAFRQWLESVEAIGMETPYRIGVFTKWGRGCALSMWGTQGESSHLEAKNRALTRIQPYWTPDLGLLTSKTVQIKILLFKSPSLWCFVIASWTN